MADTDGAYKRIMPHDNNAERAVIASMLMSQDAVSDVSGVLTKDDFYSAQYGLLFQAITSIHEEGKMVDEVILAERLCSMGAPESLCQMSYLGEIVASQSTSVLALDYARIIHDKSILRRMIKTTETIAKNCYEGQESVKEIIGNAEEEVFKICQSENGSREIVPMQTRVIRVINRIEEASRRGGMVSGLSTGFTDLDIKLSGLHAGELILVAARPAMGKTAFVLNIANHVLTNEKIPVLIFSLEMDGESLVSRIMSMNSRVDAQKIRTGALSGDEWDRIIESAEVLAHVPLFIEDKTAITVSEMRSKCRKLKDQEHIGLIVLDYLQLMTPDHKVESRQTFIADVSRALKSMARELKVPVIALSQVNREAAKNKSNHMPGLEDLRESGAIEQDADVVIFINREDYYDPDTEKKGVATINVAKQRNGSTGSIDLWWDDKHTRFANYVDPSKRW